MPTYFQTQVVPVKTAKYPGSSVSAGVVTHKSWAASDPNYKPASYTADVVTAEPSWADPGVTVYVCIVYAWLCRGLKLFMS